MRGRQYDSKLIYMAIDWSAIYKAHKGKWVALEDDEETVISVGNTAKEALEIANKKGFSHPILTKMPSDLLPLVG